MTRSRTTRKQGQSSVSCPSSARFVRRAHPSVHPARHLQPTDARVASEERLASRDGVKLSVVSALVSGSSVSSFGWPSRLSCDVSGRTEGDHPLDPPLDQRKLCRPQCGPCARIRWIASCTSWPSCVMVRLLSSGHRRTSSTTSDLGRRSPSCHGTQLTRLPALHPPSTELGTRRLLSRSGSLIETRTFRSLRSRSVLCRSPSAFLPFDGAELTSSPLPLYRPFAAHKHSVRELRIVYSPRDCVQIVH